MSSRSHINSQRRRPKSNLKFKNIEEFTILEELGRGGYSNVYLAQHKETGKKYALKAAFKYKKGKDKTKRTYMEIKVLQKLHHKHIVKFFDWFYDDDTIYLVLEHIQGKDITKFFSGKTVNKENIKKIFTQLVKAVLYIHEKNIIHRDLKLENILIDEDYQIKLTDFGLCTVKQDEYSFYETKLGTCRYTSPEMLIEDEYNESVDIWSLGVILFKLLTGKYPFDGSTRSKIFKRIKHKKIYWSKYYFDKNEESLLRKLLKKDPFNRIEIEDILSHPYFK